jgi:hypothetical protein
MSCSAPVPHDLALLGGSDTIYNDPPLMTQFYSASVPPNKASQEVTHPGTTLVEACLTAEF